MTDTKFIEIELRLDLTSMFENMEAFACIYCKGSQKLTKVRELFDLYRKGVNYIDMGLFSNGQTFGEYSAELNDILQDFFSTNPDSKSLSDATEIFVRFKGRMHN